MNFQKFYKSLNELLFIPAYYDNFKKCSLKGNWKGVQGVYFLKEKEEVIYIGMSGSDLKKTLYRHFQKWNDWRYSYYPQGCLPPYKRPTYSNREDFTISYIITDNYLELEKYYIKKYKPRDNRELYDWWEFKESIITYKPDVYITGDNEFIIDLNENLEEAPF